MALPPTDLDKLDVALLFLRRLFNFQIPGWIAELRAIRSRLTGYDPGSGPGH